jgi:hypothetical protein
MKSPCFPNAVWPHAILAGAMAALLASCATAPVPKATPLAVLNAGFEADSPPDTNCTTDWGCVMHADPRSFRFFIDEKAPASGKRSLCIEPITRQPYGKAVQSRHDFQVWGGALVRVSLSVRLENVTGPGAGPILVAHDGGGMAARPRASYVRYSEKLVNGTSGWQRVETELVIPPETVSIEFGALLQGAGRACFDDVHLEFLPAPKSPV